MMRRRMILFSIWDAKVKAAGLAEGVAKLNRRGYGRSFLHVFDK